MTNEELVLSAKIGDRQAMNELVERNEGFVRKIAYEIYRFCRETYKLTETDVDDLVQEGLLAVVNAVSKYDPESGNAFTTYAGTAARNAILDSLERRKSIVRNEKQLSDNEPSDILWLDSSDPYRSTPERIVLKKETLEQLKAAINSLSDRNKAYILYRMGFEDGKAHSLKETAEHFGLTEGRAAKTEKNALVILKRRVMT